ncbi:MAG: N-acetylmuramoyl-L-alanine amidase [Beijerinckiaceae bacterium]
MAWRASRLVAAACAAGVMLCVFFGFFLAGPVQANANLTPPPAIIITQVALTRDSSGADLVIDISRAVAAQISTIPRPDRLILDFEGARFHAAPPRLIGAGGLVKAVRFGAFMRGQGRVIIELSGPARVAEQRFLPLEGGGHRLVVRVAGADRATFMSLAPGGADDLITGSVKAKAASPADKPLIMLDPGHGGADTGAAGPAGEQEKTLVLDMAHLLRERLERGGKVRVQMTRTADIFVPLRDRVRIARQAKAALFISLHADAVPDETEVRGASVYTLSERATDEGAARLAERENRADQAGGVESKEEQDDVSDILFDLARRESRAFSGHFARGLVATLPKATRLHKNPLRGAGFRVLRAPDVPSVLVELGYLTTAEEAKVMMTDDWRRNTVDAIAEAVERFVDQKIAPAQEKSP